MVTLAPAVEEDRLAKMLATALGEHVAEYLRDSQVSEIRINPDGKLWINKLGMGKSFSGHLISEDKARNAIYAVAYSVGAVCDDKNPSLAAELPRSGERFQAVLPPVVSGPTITIRKKARKIFTLADLVEQGILSESRAECLRAAIKTRDNILIVGGTDSGKTTFANAILEAMAGSGDRIVIIEDTYELQCAASDVVYLRTVDNVMTLRDLVKTTMRLSPDRIVIGEVRGPEALDLLKAWNTGHSGGVSTVHASSAAKALSRVEQLVQEAGVLPSPTFIAEAINVLIYMEKVNGKRVVHDVVRVRGRQNNEYILEPIQ